MKKETPFLTQVRLTTAPIETYDGTYRIEKGKLVIVTKRTKNSSYEVTTLNGKTTIGIGNRLDNLAACPLTCKDDELLFMELRTDYHTYTAIGRNPVEMYKKIVWMYNRNASSNYTTANIFKQEYFDDYNCCVYKVNADFIWFDDEYRSFRQDQGSDHTTIGDWFSLYRKSTLWGKDYFKTSMR